MLAALIVTSLVILGLAKATTASIRNIGFSKDQNRAVETSQKKIAEVVDSKNQNPNFFSALPSFADSVSADGKLCLKTIVTDVTGELPPGTPDLANAKMAKISVDVFWDENGAGTDCGAKKYIHKQHFETNVTN